MAIMILTVHRSTTRSNNNNRMERRSGSEAKKNVIFTLGALTLNPEYNQ